MQVADIQAIFVHHMARVGLTKLDEDVSAELNRFSIDVKHFADYQVLLGL